MPKKLFELCKVCRVNHNHGKGHKFFPRHQQRLVSLLSKAHLKLKDISFFLNNPSFLRDTDRRHNSFWCPFCELKITEDDSIFVCSNTIRHLASSSHFEALKNFWYENGADVEKRHLYLIRIEELAKWEDACKALSSASTSMELSSGAVNNIPSACSSSVATSFCSFSVACFSNTSTSDPLPLNKDGNYNHGMVVEDMLGLNPHERVPVSQNHEDHARMTSNILVQHEGLTCVRLPSSSAMEGNVHTGAAPPWLRIADNRVTSESNALQEKGAPLSCSKETKLQKLRNPKRIGAAWADWRRVEMERDKAGDSSQKGFQGDKSWLPNFGRVWQSGSRRETRKEFEAEKRLTKGLERLKPEKPKDVQPYISKRQRLEGGSMQQQPSS